MTANFTFNGIPVVAETPEQAAGWRLEDIRREAHERTASLAPGGFWTAGDSVPLVFLLDRIQHLEHRVTLLEGAPSSPPAEAAMGAMTATRASGIIYAGAGVLAALYAAEAAIQTVLDGPGSDAEKIAAIDAIWPTWPPLPGAPA